MELYKGFVVQNFFCPVTLNVVDSETSKLNNYVIMKVLGIHKTHTWFW